jgi:hypothetical protein
MTSQPFLNFDNAQMNYESSMHVRFVDSKIFQA